MRSLFGKLPTIRVVSEQTSCDCGAPKLRVTKTSLRRVATLEIGEFDARETVLQCPACGKSYKPEDLRNRVPAWCKYGYDVIEYIGMALFTRACNELEVQHALWGRNIEISTSEIGYLGAKFIIYLAIAHRESSAQLKALMRSQGGYILHVDGTCEAESPHLMTALDGISEIVLHNVKLPSENGKDIGAMLATIKETYGEPLALVHDMGSGIACAVKEIFPKTPDYICHFHFLKDIGNDLFGDEHAVIRNALKKYRIRTELRATAKQLKKMIAQDDSLQDVLASCIRLDGLSAFEQALHPCIAAYLLVTWVLESAVELGGFGFPFDRAHFVFCKRLQAAYPVLKRLHKRTAVQKPLKKLYSLMGNTVNDPHLSKVVRVMSEKVSIFDDLRNIMRIAQPESAAGLNDEGDINISVMEEQIEAFCSSQKLVSLTNENLPYRKMLKQIHNYKDRLFVAPIEVHTQEGKTLIYPQRTNNILERFFRKFKKAERKKTGASALTRKLKSMLANTPLVQNLTNPDYLEAILKNEHSLAQRFAHIDAHLVRQELEEHQRQNARLHPKLRQLCKIVQLPEKIAKSCSKKLAA